VTALGRDDRLSFVWPENARDVVVRGAELVPHFLEWNLAAPRTVIHVADGRTVVDFPRAGDVAFRPAGLVHACLWGALVLAAIVRGARARSWSRPIVRALGLWTLALLALHLVFGTSLFLYSGQWTFAVLALVALSLDRPAGGRVREALLAALVALALLQAATSSALLLEIANAFSSPA
jgi:hypothetical protein